MLHIDFETRSLIDLAKEGVYRYSAHPSTEVICLAWAIDDGPVESHNLLLYGYEMPESIRSWVEGGGMIAAHNAAFERLIWTRVLGQRHGWLVPRLEQFYCTSALSRARGGPGKLEKAAVFYELPYKKDMEGQRLMLRMCRPRSCVDGHVRWNQDPEDMERLTEYCRQDVVVERAITSVLMPFNAKELSQYHLSERINDRGVHVDLALATAAVEGMKHEREDASAALADLTDGYVTSPNQVKRIQRWLMERGVELASLDKESIEDLLQDESLPSDVREVLDIRQEQGKAAVSKFQAMLDREEDGYLKGMYVFRGAGQTGRFASCGVQVHNLIRETDVESIKVLLAKGIDGLRLLGNPVHVLARMVRPALMADRGKVLLIGDYNAIEARITAWLANDNTLLKLFREGGDPYCDFASVAFGRNITKADELERFVGKGCILGLGFGGAEGALDKSLRKGGVVLPADRLTSLVQLYRERHDAIRRYWYRLRDAALDSMYSPGTIFSAGLIEFVHLHNDLWVRLPSGRLMCYPYARIVDGQYGDEIEYRRGNRSPKNGEKKWPTVRLWFGMLMENIAQGVALDLLLHAMQTIEPGPETSGDMVIRLHTHDEIVVEVDEEGATASMESFKAAMESAPDWAKGLPIKAEIKQSKRYRK
jgi:DNA polymerase